MKNHCTTWDKHDLLFRQSQSISVLPPVSVVVLLLQSEKNIFSV
jgi:hypothetical protein